MDKVDICRPTLILLCFHIYTGVYDISITFPLVGACSAVIVIRHVVFPAPLCPKSPNTSPGWTEIFSQIYTNTLIYASLHPYLFQK